MFLLPLLTGCLGPQARLESAHCERIENDGVLEAIRFTADFWTSGLAGHQLIYQVGLVNRRMQPIRSRDARYRNAAGNVAASRTVLVGDSPWMLEQLQVTLPSSELEIQVSDFPVQAEFGLYQTDGVCLARGLAELPLGRQRKRGERSAVTAPRGSSAGEPVARGEGEAPERAEPPELAHGGDEAPEPAGLSAAEADSRAPESDAPDRDSLLAALRAMPHSVADPDKPAALAREPSRAPGSEAAAVVPPEPPQDASVSRPPRASERERNSARRPPASQPAYREYVVKVGDTLTGIAWRELGDVSRWEEIFDLNRELISAPDVIIEGMVLRLPPIVRPSTSPAAAP
ncbi:MAG: LysM peptidoglycan-binding domain-containing protein [Phycisphaerae bacterium]|jgi:hypothetical protein